MRPPLWDVKPCASVHFWRAHSSRAFFVGVSFQKGKMESGSPACGRISSLGTVSQRSTLRSAPSTDSPQTQSQILSHSPSLFLCGRRSGDKSCRGRRQALQPEKYCNTLKAQRSCSLRSLKGTSLLVCARSSILRKQWWSRYVNITQN